MQPWLQHLLVLLLVGACFGYVAWQGGKTLFGRKSKLGACCSKGCGEHAPMSSSSDEKKPERVIFLPVEMLTKRR